jgi:hypothetical protein
VHEVEALLAHPREQSRFARGLHGVPAHVWHDGRAQPLNNTWPLAATLRLDSVLDPAREQHLKPHADAQDRSTTGKSTTDDLRTVDGAETGHARGVGADSGND